MNPKLEETITLDFTTSNPTTGAVADADSSPTVKVFEDANDTPILTLTAVKRTGETGNYRASVACTVDNGFEEGKSYNAVALATVVGVAGKGVVGRWQMRLASIDDVEEATGQLTFDVDGELQVEVAEAAAILAIVNKLNTMLEVDGMNWRLTVDSLFNVPSGGAGGLDDHAKARIYGKVRINEDGSHDHFYPDDPDTVAVRFLPVELPGGRDVEFDP